MTRHQRLAVAAGGALLVGMLGMLAAEATCTSNGTSPPDGYSSVTVCWLEGTDHGQPYTGRDARPLTVSTYGYNNDGSSDSTSVEARQNRVGYADGGQTWRESVIEARRQQYIAGLSQSLSGVVGLYQYDYTQTSDPGWRYTTLTGDVQTSGAQGTVHVYVGAQQYRSGEQCRESGQVYLQVNGSTSSTPLEERDCAMEAPTIPDMP